MKKTVIRISLTVLFVCLLIFILDLINITRYVPLTKDYDWLTFSGQIIAGLTVMIGVAFVVRRQSKADRASKRFSVVPILKYEIEANGEAQAADCRSLNLTVSNDGIGHAVIEKADMILRSSATQERKKHVVCRDFVLIKQNEAHSLPVSVPMPEHRPKKESFDTAELTVVYRDMLGNAYRQRLHIRLPSQEHDLAEQTSCDSFRYIGN